MHEEVLRGIISIIMAIITREQENMYGEVAEAKIDPRIPILDQVMLPACYLLDAVRYQARYRVRVGHGDSKRFLRFSIPERDSDYLLPKEGDSVTVVSTRFKIFGHTLPVIGSNRLAI